MAKRKPRAWTKKDIAELKAHSKARTPVSKISKVIAPTTEAPSGERSHASCGGLIVGDA